MLEPADREALGGDLWAGAFGTWASDTRSLVSAGISEVSAFADVRTSGRRRTGRRSCSTCWHGAGRTPARSLHTGPGSRPAQNGAQPVILAQPAEEIAAALCSQRAYCGLQSEFITNVAKESVIEGGNTNYR